MTERESGTYFDWISSAGGLNKGLRLLFGLVVNFLNYNVYSVYMVSHLFKMGSKKQDGTKRRKTRLRLQIDKTMEESTNPLNPKKINSMKMLFFAAIPNSWRKRLEGRHICKCLRRGKNYILFD